MRLPLPTAPARPASGPLGRFRIPAHILPALPMPRRRPAPVAVAAPVPAPVPDPIPAALRFFVAWTRAGTLRFRWSGLPAWSDRPITASLSDRPDAPNTPLALHPRLRCGDVASPLHAARRLAALHQLGEPVRQVMAVE